jgi:hypothetical protein
LTPLLHFYLFEPFAKMQPTPELTLILREGDERMTGIVRGERLQLMLTPEELTVLDNFRFKHRMPSRAAAVRELLKRGLAAEGFDQAAFGAKSSHYGIVGDGPEDTNR